VACAAADVALERDAADKFFSSVIMKAHSFVKPKESPYKKQNQK
jgi:hypothetical protein